MHKHRPRMDDYLLSVLSTLEKSHNTIEEADKSYQNNSSVYINAAPRGLKREFDELLTRDAIEFMVELVVNFEKDIERLYSQRLERKAQFKSQPKVPRFNKTPESGDWKVSPVPNRLKNRHLDLGDVSPSNLSHFTSALLSPVQGIQVDFDDGHCPTWKNQISGLHNVLLAVQNRLPNVPPISQLPVLVLRPRAWNMLESNVLINGKQVPGPLFDFSLLIYHTGKILNDLESGPAFYLSKLESSEEARLWNDIFSWSELRLRLPHGTIKACVLIENILASFEMENILYELREHSLGLNCGIWDYAASIISKFGAQNSFLLPDRNKYVNMSRKFLKKYMELVIKTCHKHGAHATGGMAAVLLPEKDDPKFEEVLKNVCQAKLTEIRSGIDGFMVYDVKLVAYMNFLWKEHGGPAENQIFYPGTKEPITEEDLLSLPKGGVTLKGLEHNVRVAILFNYHWLNGRGHFFLGGAVEDSATAEISRSQIWQWIRHKAVVEDDGSIVTLELVKNTAQKVLREIRGKIQPEEKEKIVIGYELFLELVCRREFVDFVTTFIYEEVLFKKYQSHL